MDHTDFIGRPLEVGDTVAYPSGRGVDKRMCVAEIVKFNDKVRQGTKKENNKYVPYDIPYWTVKLQPLERSGYGGRQQKYDYEKREYITPKRGDYVQVTVQNVFNLVKVDI